MSNNEIVSNVLSKLAKGTAGQVLKKVDEKELEIMKLYNSCKEGK